MFVTKRVRLINVITCYNTHCPMKDYYHNLLTLHVSFCKSNTFLKKENTRFIASFIASAALIQVFVFNNCNISCTQYMFYDHVFNYYRK